MGRRDLLNGWWGRTALSVLVVVILAAGLCCFDQDQSAMDDYGMPMDLCFLMLVIPAVVLLLAGLLPRRLVVSLGPPVLAVVPLAVPKPPPRFIGLR